MKKSILIFSLAAASALSANSIQSVNITCPSGAPGFEIKVSSSNANSAINYSSCVDGKINVVAADYTIGESSGNQEGSSGEQVVEDEPYVPFTGSFDLYGTTYTFWDGDLGQSITLSIADSSDIQEFEKMRTLGWGSITLYSSLNTDVEPFKYLQSVQGGVDLRGGQLETLQGLRSLETTGGDLNVSNNNLTNLDGLENLTSTNSIYADGNNLTNVNGISGVQDTKRIWLNGNPNLDDLSGLSTIANVQNEVKLDNREYAVKMDANSYICQNYEILVTGVSQKSYVCN